MDTQIIDTQIIDNQTIEYITIASKKLSIVSNASGCWVKSPSQIDKIAHSVNTVLSKTCTLNPRETNPLPNFIELGTLSVNCKGLPNMGYLVYRNLWRKYYDMGITYILSLDASNLPELIIMLKDYDLFIEKKKYEKQDPIKELVEINISCPNLSKGDGNGTYGFQNHNINITRIIGYDVKCLDKVLTSIQDLQLKNITIGLKLPPYIDRFLLYIVGNILKKYLDTVKYIVCCNTIPNAMIMDSKPTLSMGVGGISGLPTKLIALANVHQFRFMFKSNINIIGCGGIETIDDVIEYISAGADCVQIGRILHIEGVDKLMELNRKIISKL